MNSSEQLAQLIANQDQPTLVSFLRELSHDQRRFLMPITKRLVKEYFEYQPNSLGVWRQKANSQQQQMLILTSLMTMNRTEYTRVDANGWLLSSPVIDILRQEYCPSWFSDYVNALAGRSSPPWLHYLCMVELKEAGFINPSPELIAHLLPQSVLEYQRSTQVFRFANLFKHPATLEEHIWYLFQYESNIHWSERFARQDTSGKVAEQSWSKLLVSLADQGAIDRLRLLRETILAMTRFQNKNLVGWFVELLTQLAPNPEELLSLQTELSATFYSAHSKPINTTLKYYKQLVTDERFDADTWLENVSILLTSETKSIVTAALMIMDKCSVPQMLDSRSAILRCRMTVGGKTYFSLFN